MSLEDDLKAKTLALISQQMANWVVSIQRQIADHQGNLVRTLDDLSESVARYDEKIDEGEIAAAMAAVVATQPAAAPKGPGIDKLRASLAEIEKGTSLSEVLTHLVGEVTKHLDRAAMFILKNNTAVGWYARGFDHNEVVKALTIPLTADTVFRVVSASRRATRGHVTHSPGTMQALSRLGGDPQGVLAVPLILRDKVAAVLYCDTPQDEVPASAGDVIEILVSYAGKVIDVLSAQPRAGGPAPAPGGTAPGGTSPGMRPPAPAAPPSPLAESSPRGFSPEGGAMRAQPAATVYRPPTAPPGGRLAPPPAPPTPAPRALPPEEQKAHDDAKRFARLVVSEIKLYNEAKVTEGRKTRDIYERLKEDIERGRQMYHDRVSATVRDASDYFQDELVRILAGGDANALGPM